MRRALLQDLERQFAALYERSRALAALVPDDKLYWRPREPSAGLPPAYSCGESLLRSAAAVEQTCGGITANLWDDPFEWTLPEALPGAAQIGEYLAETEATRARTFASITSDDHLSQEIMAPSGRVTTLFSVLLETLARASYHQGRAAATFRLFSAASLPHI